MNSFGIVRVIAVKIIPFGVDGLSRHAVIEAIYVAASPQLESCLMVIASWIHDKWCMKI